MKGALQIARIAGIPVQVHWTFLLLLGWAFYMVWKSPAGLDPLVAGRVLLSVAALFACVVLHELGHALMARRYGIQTRNILLLPIGGLAMLESLPEKPWQEFLVAFAGPLVNIVLAILFLPLLLLVPEGLLMQVVQHWANPGGNVFLNPQTSFWSYFIVGLILLNALVAVFNLIPAFPMDGGRILRALLSVRLSRLRATRIATLIGQAFAVFLILASLGDFNWLMIFVGVFIFITARREYQTMRDQALLDSHTVRDAMQPQPVRLYERDSVAFARDALRQRGEAHALVFDEWQTYRGIIALAHLEGLVRKHATTPIGHWITRTTQALLPDEDIPEALGQLHQLQATALPVFDRDHAIGLLDGQGLDQFLKRRMKAK